MNDVYERSRAAWDTYATIDAPRYPDDLWSAVQVQLYRWQVRNFDLQPASRFVLGIVEEVGELGEAAESGDEEAILDAIGDICVYATQLANAHRLDFGVLLLATSERQPTQPVDVTLGRIAHAVLKTEQRIRGYDNPEKGRREVAENLVSVLYRLRDQALILGSDLEEVYATVAARVLQRDWKADPVSAAGAA